MRKEIIINDSEHEQRIAITEEGRLAELFMESPERERMVGDVYMGRVAKIMPGIRACFIDIGMEVDSFLNFSDLSSAYSEMKDITGEEEEIDTDEEEEEGEQKGKEKEKQKGREKGGRRRRRPEPPAHVNLQKGQDIVVQIFKEPVGKKGCRVTSEVSLPGRFLVLMPFDQRIGVSRKISNFKEKRRLRTLVRSILPTGFGAIIRTVAEGREEEVLRNDLNALIQTWREVEKKIRTQKGPGLLHKDMNTSSSVIRDLFTPDVTRIATDSKKLYRDIRAYVNMVAPNMVEHVEFYSGKQPIFDVFGIEKDIEQTLARKIWLKSGGYLIFDHTEAMHVIDVNSGRYAPDKQQEVNSLKTNLDAVKELSRQIRLRDLGGILIIDFIDMQQEASKRKVFEEMRREFKRDRAKSTILPLTDFGIMQITRQRVRESILHSFSETCPTCGGRGRVQSKSSMLTQIARWVRRFRSDSKELRLTLHVHPSVAEYLSAGSISRLTKLSLKNFIRIKLKPDPEIPVDEFRFYSARLKRDVTNEHHA